MIKNKKLKNIIEILRVHFNYDEIQTYPRFDHPDPRLRRDYWHVLFQIIISHRATLEKEIEAANNLFYYLPTLSAIAEADEIHIGEYIKVSGMYNQKAKAIKYIANHIIEKMNGDLSSFLRLPLDKIRIELLKLPKVGYKTADCMLELGFGLPSMAVDTNVKRVSNRLQLVNEGTDDYEEIRLKLESYMTKDVETYRDVHTFLLAFGKFICKAKPKCSECMLTHICNSKDKRIDIIQNKLF